ncbi:MAG: response regulator [Candidatus Hodarchaeales archaeon]
MHTIRSYELSTDSEMTPGSESNQKYISILLVDDDELFLELSREMLMTIGSFIEIHSVSDPRIALDLLERRKFDVIISDYRMPGLNGLELMEKLREMGLETPFIILTSSENILSTALELGADHCFLKSLDPGVLYIYIYLFIRTMTY